MKTNVDANKYLLLQRVITLMQKSNENIVKYFRRMKSLTKHFSSATEIIEYNVIKNKKDKSQKKRVNFECNKDKDFSLKKIKQVIQVVYQTVDIVSSFDSK